MTLTIIRQLRVQALDYVPSYPLVDVYIIIIIMHAQMYINNYYWCSLFPLFLLGQLSHQTAPLVHCASGKVPISTREEWRSVSTGAGEPFVTTAGTAKMPPLCAEILATTPQVSVVKQIQ